MDSLLPFAAVAFVVVASPGPDLALVTRSVLVDGRRGGLLTALGIASGSATWAVAATVGLVSLLSSPAMVTTVRWLGAGFLAYLGLRAVMRPPTADATGSAPGAAPYRTGLVGNLLHPGQIVLYTGLLPPFMDPASAVAGQALRLGGLFAAIALAWFSAYALVVSSVPLRRWRSAIPVLSRLTGATLVGFAVVLVARS